MQEMLLIIQLFLAAALIGMVLLQRSDSDGFGLGSGGSNFLSGRTTANLMTRTTAILAALFMLNSLILSIVASHRGSDSIVGDVTQQEQPVLPVGKDPLNDNPKATGDAPKTDATKPTQPAAKAAPEVPKVPVNAAPAARAKPVVKKSAEPAAKPVESGEASDKKPEEE